METIEKTRGQVREIINSLNFIDKSKNNRLSYYSAILLKECAEIEKETRNKENDLGIDFCALNEHGEIKQDAQGRLVFKKDDQKKMNEAVLKLSKEIVSIPVKIIKDKKADELPMDIKLILNGVLLEINENDFPEKAE